MESCVYNFSPGPAVLPLPALEERSETFFACLGPEARSLKSATAPRLLKGLSSKPRQICEGFSAYHRIIMYSFFRGVRFCNSAWCR